MAAADIEAVMAMDDVPVQCVLLAADGTVCEKTVDMTPRKAEVKELLGGQPTFIGQWTEVGKPEWNVMLVALAQPPESCPANQHNLPSPFQEVASKGDILLFRNDEDAKPVDFTVADYEQFQEDSKLKPRLAPDPDAAGSEDAAGEGVASEDTSSDDEEDDEDSDEEEGSEEEGEMSEEQELLLKTVIEGFTNDKGRAPTEPELVDIMTRLNEAMMAAGSDEDEDEGESSDGEFEGDAGPEDDEATIEEQEASDDSDSKRESAPSAGPAGSLLAKHKIDMTPSPALRKVSELETSSMAAPTKKPKVA